MEHEASTQRQGRALNATGGALLALLMASSCAERVIDMSAETSEDEPSQPGSGEEDGPPGDPSSDPSDPSSDDPIPPNGSRPSEPGAMYSACRESRGCFPMELCVFPEDESGFCTSRCGEAMAESCEVVRGADVTIMCLDIDLPDGAPVCALSCADAECPEGMRCEAIGTSDGERHICF